MGLKVLIIDDESIILEGLCAFPWEEYDCYVAGKAMNGDTALEIVENVRPDLILSDIKMPGMDGLTFAERVKQIYPDTVIILLTGYDCFEFAQRAIRVGVCDYLLKPINFNEMKKLIARTSNEIRMRYANKEYYEELITKYKKMLPMLKSKICYDLLHGHFRDREEMQKKMMWTDIKIEKYIVLSVRMEENQGIEAGIEPWLLEFALMNIGEEILKDYCEQVLSDYEDNNLSFIISFCKKASDKDCISKCLQACERIQQVVLDFVRINLCIGISDVNGDSYFINKYYLQALEACRQGAYFGNDTILQYGDVAEASEEWIVTDGEKQGLFSEILSGDVEKVKLHIESLFSGSCDDMNIIKSEALEMLIDCLRSLRSKNGSKNLNYSISNGLEQIDGCSDKFEIQEYLKRIFTVIAHSNSESDIDKHQTIVKNITRYIEEHYMDDISLDNLSDIFHLSRTYISRLLRQYVHKSFLEIVIDIRMLKAEKLIVEKKYKINKIAEMVGFRDFSYFIQVFKKKFGVTPKEYRRII